MTGSVSDLDPLEEHLLESIASIDTTSEAEPWPTEQLDVSTARTLFEAQVLSRLLDHTARWLRADGHGYYTIGSAGHEANATVALGLRPTDPALLHYRSGGFYNARASQVPGSTPVLDVLSGMLALAAEPIAGGRHKVFGHRGLHIIPQTSTIASHLPRAVGLAHALGRAGERNHRTPWPDDAVVVCSFGDASLNHSTTQGALNWAAHSQSQGHRVPIVFVCEDNGIGISVPSPDQWVFDATADRPFRFCSVDGSDPAAVADVTADLVDHARRGIPAFLQLRTVRYLGHAGSDVESAYRSAAEIRADYAADPILGTARLLVRSADVTPLELTDWYLERRAAMRIDATTLLGSRRAGVSHRDHDAARSAATGAGPRRGPSATASRLRRPIGSRCRRRQTLAQSLNATLGHVLDHYPQALVFGEDVGKKGGVYGVTRGLQRRFGAERVFDTILDEQSILGMALGTGLADHIPIPEIQFLAYLHNAEDQLRGEAATLRFFSNGQYRNPMVLRIAGYGYQKGFGGHFHNDNSVAVLRDIPGVVIASPAHPSDAAAMLRTCVASAAIDGTVSCFLEPIALYHTTDLHQPGDRLWLADPNEDDTGHVPIGVGCTHGHGGDLTIITWGNGLHLGLRAAQQLHDADVGVRVLDLRWLAPLPIEDIMREAEATGRVLVVDETRRTGGVGEGVIAELVQHGFRGHISRVAAKDSFVPLGAAAELVLVSVEEILDGAVELLGRT